MRLSAGQSRLSAPYQMQSTLTCMETLTPPASQGELGYTLATSLRENTEELILEQRGNACGLQLKQHG